LETTTVKFWYHAHMVHMGMGQKYMGDGRGIKWQRSVAGQKLFTVLLDEAAIDQDLQPSSMVGQVVAAAGDTGAGAEEVDEHGMFLWLWCWVRAVRYRMPAQYAGTCSSVKAVTMERQMRAPAWLSATTNVIGWPSGSRKRRYDLPMTACSAYRGT
jgi:hypothetical protein